MTVSLPDDVFEKVEQLAQRTRRSVDDVIAGAASEYVTRQAIDRGLEEVGDQEDEFIAAASRQRLEKTEW